MKSKAIIVLHEIYGVNDFIKSVYAYFEASGFDVFCPNLLKRPPFLYSETEKAYKYFFENVGFGVKEEINHKISELKAEYEKVYVIGFSVGATLSFICSENKDLSGAIGLYGSRIRDYTEINPACPTLLLFAKFDSFNVDELIEKLKGKPNLSLEKYNASHGFINPFEENFDAEAKTLAEAKIFEFLKD